ncbi:hypothetical protein M5K25_026849 [Dendrobium thyrsiflorum]|uniref:Uncharacterized protein n=1 Tax=Dendrobium thyrsiflorum TaxID=117978 RepID=A0ABD0TYH6_DENTH
MLLKLAYFSNFTDESLFKLPCNNFTIAYERRLILQGNFIFFHRAVAVLVDSVATNQFVVPSSGPIYPFPVAVSFLIVIASTKKLRSSTSNKVVLKLSMENNKQRAKALKCVTKLLGIVSMSADDEKITVVGEGIDPVKLTNMLRKKIRCVELVMVNPVKEEKTVVDAKNMQPRLILQGNFIFFHCAVAVLVDSVATNHFVLPSSGPIYPFPVAVSFLIVIASTKKLRSSTSNVRTIGRQEPYIIAIHGQEGGAQTHHGEQQAACQGPQVRHQITRDSVGVGR